MSQAFKTFIPQGGCVRKGGWREMFVINGMTRLER